MQLDFLVQNSWIVDRLKWSLSWKMRSFWKRTVPYRWHFCIAARAAESRKWQKRFSQICTSNRRLRLTIAAHSCTYLSQRTLFARTTLAQCAAKSEKQIRPNNSGEVIAQDGISRKGAKARRRDMTNLYHGRVQEVGRLGCWLPVEWPSLW